MPYKTHKITLDPTFKQRRWFSQQCGYVRFAYNQALSDFDAFGIPVLEAPQFYASSKTCSSCRHRKDDLTLSERTYHCSQCDYQIDRDVNAAINLKHLAVG